MPQGAGSPSRPPVFALSSYSRYSAGDCRARLSQSGVRFEAVDANAARGVGQPIRLTGAVGGIEVKTASGRKTHGILDCRLALGLLHWAPVLRRAGVHTIEHYSIYRPGARTRGRRKVSGHARGLALDAARFHLEGGTVLDVETDWEERSRGEAPCPKRPHEAWGSRLLRGVVCDAVAMNLFQVVITPHHDAAHDNHIHLELKPDVDWTYVR